MSQMTPETMTKAWSKHVEQFAAEIAEEIAAKAAEEFKAKVKARLVSSISTVIQHHARFELMRDELIVHLKVGP